MPTKSCPRRWTSSMTTSRGWSSIRPWRYSDAGQAARPREPAHQGGGLPPPAAGAEGPAPGVRDRDRGGDVEGSPHREDLHLRARRRGAVEGVDDGARERARLRAQVAARAPRPAGHARPRFPRRPLARARRAHSVAPQAGAGAQLVSDAPRVPADVLAALDRAPGRALMLG